MPSYKLFLTTALEKVFPGECPPPLPEGFTITALRGEVPAIQLVYYKAPGGDTPPLQPFEVQVLGAPVPARLRQVGLIPSTMPAYEVADENYLTTTPGLFPDLLTPLETPFITPIGGQYRSLWVDLPGLGNAAPGSYTITLRAEGLTEASRPNGKTARFPGAPVFEESFRLELLPAALPPQTIHHTEWLHTDCLASFYGIPVFSEAWWHTVEQFIAAARGYTVDTLLTPIFTPPLDTAVGHTRTPVQLVDITLENSRYIFGFDKLARWCALCHKHGIHTIEVPHLFTQWGARATPQIVATENGEQNQLFGWHVPAASPAYRRFLEAFLPTLQKALTALGYGPGHVLFHISDEPGEKHLESYAAAKNQVAGLLDGWQVMDALSDLSFYKQGLVSHPIPAEDAIEPFLAAQVPGLWCYHCCAQYKAVPNRFFAMPSARNRVLGLLLYTHGIEGFLHWGFNFYSTEYSLRPLDPFLETSAGGAFPSGDAFLVYPGPGGTPLGSIRGEVLRQSFHDAAALKLLENLKGRAFALKLIESATGPLSFTHYPQKAGALHTLREQVSAAIKAAL